MATLKEAADTVKFFIDKYGEDEQCAFDLWTREDVGIIGDFTKDGADEILFEFHNSKDAELGLNWPQLRMISSSLLEG